MRFTDVERKLFFVTCKSIASRTRKSNLAQPILRSKTNAKHDSLSIHKYIYFYAQNDEPAHRLISHSMCNNIDLSIYLYIYRQYTQFQSICTGYQMLNINLRPRGFPTKTNLKPQPINFGMRKSVIPIWLPVAKLYFIGLARFYLLKPRFRYLVISRNETWFLAVSFPFVCKFPSCEQVAIYTALE